MSDLAVDVNLLEELASALVVSDLCELVRDRVGSVARPRKLLVCGLDDRDDLVAVLAVLPRECELLWIVLGRIGDGLARRR